MAMRPGSLSRVYLEVGHKFGRPVAGDVDVLLTISTEEKQSDDFSSKRMGSPEQREKELEQPADGVDPVQGLDALPELGGRVPRGAESLAEVGGGDEGDQ